VNWIVVGYLESPVFPCPCYWLFHVLSFLRSVNLMCCLIYHYFGKLQTW
jgi:hypothetical protein